MRAQVPLSLLGVFAAGAGLGIGVASRTGTHPPLAVAAASPSSAPAVGATQEEQTVIGVARSVTPVVVSITVPSYGSGSGAIIRPDGMILTNAHVVGTARAVRADIDSMTARYYGLPVSAGVMVAQVQPGSPAAAAGLRPQDIIVDMDGQPVRGSGDLGRILRGHKPGDTARLTVVRPPNGVRATISVELGQAPA